MKNKHKKIKKWENKSFDTIIDVRSPSEYEEDHIIGSINCPVLYDQERIIVGSIYKKESTFDLKKFCMEELNYSKYIDNFNGSIDTLLIP